VSCVSQKTMSGPPIGGCAGACASVVVAVRRERRSVCVRSRNRMEDRVVGVVCACCGVINVIVCVCQ